MKTDINYKTTLRLAVCILLLSSLGLDAQVLGNFTPRLNQTVQGDVTIIANNVISRTATGNYNGEVGNHDFIDNVYVDIDNDATTFNSSSAMFDNPAPSVACLEIAKAYLYWAASDKEPDSDINSENQPNWDYNDIKLMLPGQASYTTITADEVIYRGRDEINHFSNDPYVCIKDITSLVNDLTNPFGKYQIANIEAKTGSLIDHGGSNTGTSGGWQIVFVYESPQLPSKNIGLFDGYAHVRNGVSGVDNDFDIDFNGFQTVPFGDVSAKIVIGSLEGDGDLAGDKLQIKNVANNFVDINAGTIRAADNFFNSRITIGNSDFINRNPASTNTLGFDAAVFDLNNPNNSIITNDQTSATLRLTSNQETYGLFLVGLSVDVWSPDINPLHVTADSESDPINAGDSLGYSFDLINDGNDDAVNVSISTILPEQLAGINPTDLPNGVTFTFNETTRELVFNIADGLVDVGDPALNITFDLVIEDACYFLEEDCNLEFELQFEATFNGIQNPTEQTTLSSAGLDECNLGDSQPVIITINQPILSWTNPNGDLDRVIACDDSEGLNDAQSLEPDTQCDLVVTKTSGDFVPDPSCSISGTYTNTWTVTDACGVTLSDYTQTITVTEVSGLAFVEPLPQDITVQCDDIPDAEILTATVDCGNATVSFVENVAEGSCDGESIITRVWTATDDCENTIEHTQIITVVDTTNPTFTVPIDLSLECNQDVTDLGLTGDVIDASDNCSTNLNISYTDNIVEGSCANEFIITRTWSVADDCGNTAVADQTISISDTLAPIIDSEASDLTVECDGTGNTTDLQDWLNNNGGALASDNCSTISWSNDFTTLSDECGATGSATVTFTATDACGNTATTTATFAIEDTTAPVIDSEASDNTIECEDFMGLFNSSGDGSNLSIQEWLDTNGGATASDNCSSVSWTNNYSGLSDDCGETGFATVTFTATDACGNIASTTATYSIIDTVPPTIDNDASDVTIECEDYMGLFNSNGNGTQISLQEWLDANGGATAADSCGTVIWTNNFTELSDECGNTGSATVTFTATDECGNSTTTTATYAVIDTVSPTIDIEATDASVECDGTGNIDVLQEWLNNNGGATATDSCSGVTWTNDYSDLSDECGGTGSATITFTAMDECGNTSTTSATFTITDTAAPTLITDYQEELNGNCSDIPGPTQLEFEDACASDITVEFNESNTFDGVNDYEIYYEWTVSDDCGNTAIYLQTVFVTLESNVSGQDMSLCVEDSPIDLFDQLSGDYNPNGVWTVTSGDATLIDGYIFDPSTVEIGDYEFTYQDNDPVCPSDTTIAIIVHDECVVLPCGAEDVVISKAVTANGDQYNEFFTVTGVESCGYTIDVQIYNRWGAMIFEATNYQNNWNGDAHGNAVGSSNKVPTGTYYYIVKLNGSGLKPFSGPIYVGTK